MGVVRLLCCLLDSLVTVDLGMPLICVPAWSRGRDTFDRLLIDADWCAPAYV